MADIGKESSKGSSEAQQSSTSGAPLLRPSTFKPSPSTGSGIIQPAHLGNNPFVARQPAAAAPSDSGLKTSISNNPFAAKIGNTASSDDNSQQESSSHRFILRPSALDKQTASLSASKSDSSASYKSSFKLEPAKIKNPFLQTNSSHPAPSDVAAPAEASNTAVGAQQSEEIKQRLFGGETSENGIHEEKCFQATDGSARDSGKSSSLFVFGEKMQDRVTNAAHSSSAPESSASTETSSGFIFGQNLEGRIVATPHHRDKEKDKEVSPEQTSAAESADTPAKTLEESAALYEAKHAKPELAEVDVKTGEEAESNVFQLNAKLYVFCKDTQSWIERGRGSLRLNDISDDDGTSFQSRLVMRTQGSLRLVLNTKIWPGMTIERASSKSIRICAMDQDEGLKIFLITATPNDSDQIFSAIDSRVQQLKSQEVEEEEEEEEESKEDEADGANRSESHGAEKHPSPPAPDKRQSDTTEETAPVKKRRMDPEQRREAITEESNDSSTVDPETEASNESFASSPTIKSSSSDA